MITSMYLDTRFCSRSTVGRNVYIELNSTSVSIPYTCA